MGKGYCSSKTVFESNGPKVMLWQDCAPINTEPPLTAPASVRGVMPVFYTTIGYTEYSR